MPDLLRLNQLLFDTPGVDKPMYHRSRRLIGILRLAEEAQTNLLVRSGSDPTGRALLGIVQVLVRQVEKFEQSVEVVLE